MIGQYDVLRRLNSLIENNTLSRFLIMIGANGSEKNSIAPYIAERLDAICVEVDDCKVETIREICENAYKVSALTIYNIKDADQMSLQAKNSLLKITEEPPNKAYFVMTLEDYNNTLPTIRSRADMFFMQPYTSEQLTNYGKKQYGYNQEELDIVIKICQTPGDVDLLASYNTKDFYAFIEKTVDNITMVSGSNVFKMAKYIKFKDTDEGYDLQMFWRAFCVVCYNRKFYLPVKITSRYSALLYSKSINKQMLFDMWILEIREKWLEVE